jgi:hypothetical protein
VYPAYGGDHSPRAATGVLLSNRRKYWYQYGIMHTIVFDLDGTLVDSAPDLISTLNLVLACRRLATMLRGE